MHKRTEGPRPRVRMRSACPAPVPERAFYEAVARAAAAYAASREGYAVLRAAMRDLGDGALGQAMAERSGDFRCVCRLEDGTWALLVAPGPAEEVNRLAFALARRTRDLAAAAGLPPVQVITGGMSSERRHIGAGALLAGAEHAFELAPRAARGSAVGDAPG